MKRCNTCNQDKPEEDFHTRSDRPGGRQSKCKSCTSAYKRAHYQKNKDRYKEQAAAWKRAERKRFFSWLATQSCVDCGEDDFVVLEFDHVKGKNFNIGERIGYLSFDKMMEEVALCDIVCANCHRRRTARREGYYDYMR